MIKVYPSQLFKNGNIQSNQAIQLRAGQIFQGKVLKLFPNHIAQVQLGGLKVHARMEVALSAHSNYWFQVQPNKEMLELKVMGGPANSKQSLETSTAQEGRNQQLFTQLGITKTKENMQLLNEFVQKQIPFTKENITTGAKWMNETPDQQKSLSALLTMFEKDLPFSKEVFKSLLAFQDQKTMAGQLNHVKSQLSDLQINNSDVRQLMDVIQRILGSQNQPSAQDVILSLLKGAINKDGITEEMSILEKLNIIPKGSSKDDLLKVLTNQIRSGDLRNLLETSELNDRQLKVKNLPFQLFMNVENHQDENQKATVIERILTSINKGIDTNRTIQMVQELIKPMENSNQFLGRNLTSNDILALQSHAENLTTHSKAFPIESGLNKEIGQFLKNSFALLGLQFEHDLGNKADGSTRDLQTLKPLLLNLIQQEGLPQSLREDFQQLVHRITGQQLMAVEQNGPLQQLVMQIPLQFGKHQTDLTLQWQGKKKENGEIDSDYCRILFYLELAAIKETVIDVHVQNRIINIELINDTPGLKIIAGQFESKLRKQLSDQNYKLSSLKVRGTMNVQKKQSQNEPQMLYRNTSYHGVDFRV